jgi:ankyrin repeat protein
MSLVRVFQTLPAFLAFLLCVHGAAWAGPAEDLRKAVELDNAWGIRQLLAKGADPNGTDAKGTPLLISAIQENALEAARELLKSPKLDPDAENRSSENALMLAALRGHFDIVKILVEKHDAEVNKKGWAPLHYAAAGGHLEIARYLLDHAAYVDAESPNLTTPLMMAARSGNIHLVKLLLDEGAVVTLKNQRNMTAVDFARQADHTEIADGLASRLRKLQPGTRSGW